LGNGGVGAKVPCTSNGKWEISERSGPMTKGSKGGEKGWLDGGGKGPE